MASDLPPGFDHQARPVPALRGGYLQEKANALLAHCRATLSVAAHQEAVAHCHRAVGRLAPPHARAWPVDATYPWLDGRASLLYTDGTSRRSA